MWCGKSWARCVGGKWECGVGGGNATRRSVTATPGTTMEGRRGRGNVNEWYGPMGDKSEPWYRRQSTTPIRPVTEAVS